MGSFGFAFIVLGTAGIAQSPPPSPPPVPTEGAAVGSGPGPASKVLESVAEQSLAASTGLAPDKVGGHVAASRRLAAAAVASALDPDDPAFAGAYLEAEPATQLTILFVGSENALRQRLNIPSDLAASIKFTPAQLPLQALRAQQQRFLRSRGLQGQQAATYIDQRNNRIVVQVENSAEFERRRRAGEIDLPANARVEIGPLPKELAGTQPATAYKGCPDENRRAREARGGKN